VTLKPLLFCIALVWIFGCQFHGVPEQRASAPPTRLDNLPQRPVPDAEDPRHWITRTTVESGIHLSISVPADSQIGSPIPVVVELDNDYDQPLLLTYSRPIRSVWPAVWFNASGKMRLTERGQQELGSREEFSNRTYEVHRGQPWRAEFDLAEYYEFPLPHDYTLALKCHAEKRDPKTNERTTIQFEIGGIRVRVHGKVR
jgi:hypothetical protein